MIHYLNLVNMIAGLSDALDRLTMLVRRREPRGNRDRLHQQSSQSPPRRNVGLWAHRLRIQSVRPEYLSDHLRRDIGLDL